MLKKRDVDEATSEVGEGSSAEVRAVQASPQDESPLG